MRCVSLARAGWAPDGREVAVFCLILISDFFWIVIVVVYLCYPSGCVVFCAILMNGIFFVLSLLFVYGLCYCDEWYILYSYHFCLLVLF